MNWNKFLILVFVAGCGTGSSSESSSGSEELQGTWQTSCLKESSTSIQKTYKFTGSQFELTTIKYTGTECSSKISTAYSAGSYTFASEANSVSAKEIDFTFTTMEATFHQKTYVDQANSGEIGEAKDWTLDVKKSVLGKRQNKLTSKTYGPPEFNIYKVDGANLYFGKVTGSIDASSKESRPTTLDDSKPFSKK